MSVTTKDTLKKVLQRANLAQVADCFAKMDLAAMLTPMKRTFTGLTSATSFDLTLIDGTGETVGAGNTNRRAALAVSTLRVTAGAAAAAARIVTDVGGTPSASLAKISDDGKTVTFEAGVTAFVIEYIPRSLVDMNGPFVLS